jgi:hypothetical protein
MKFSGETVEADFLFGPEIPLYLDEIFKRAMLLHKATVEYRDLFPPPPPPEYDHQTVVDALKLGRRGALLEEHRAVKVTPHVAVALTERRELVRFLSSSASTVPSAHSPTRSNSSRPFQHDAPTPLG